MWSSLQERTVLFLGLIGLCVYVFVRICVFIPAFFRVLVSLVVEFEGDLGVQSDAEVVVHYTLLWTLSTEDKTSCRLFINAQYKFKSQYLAAGVMWRTKTYTESSLKVTVLRLSGFSRTMGEVGLKLPWPGKWHDG